jgi:probable HAF family extracellular repeat protein
VATRTGANSIDIYADNGPGVIAGYEVIDLGTLGGNSAVPFGINDQGQVVGHSTTANGEHHAFLWENGAMRDLAPDRSDTRATIITNSGIIGGYEYRNPNSRILTWTGGVTTMLPFGGEGGATLVALSEADALLGSESPDAHHDRSFIWSGGVKQELGGLPAAQFGSSLFSWAKAMNDAGQIVGSSQVGEYAGSPISHAFIWGDGVMRDLGLLGETRCDSRPDISCGAAVAEAINNHGVVAGWSTDATGSVHAVLWTNGTTRDLGPGRALAINDAGDVMAYMGDMRQWIGDATVWHGNTAVPIGSLGGRGTIVSALSESGSVIGASNTATGRAHAFVWQRDRGMVDLGTGPAGAGRDAVAVAMNSRGDIIGYTATCSTSEYGGVASVSCAFDGESRAILWRRK